MQLSLRLKYIIYALVDPRDGQARYVGRSSSGLKRPRQHTTPSSLMKSSYKNNWLRALLRSGKRCEIAVLYRSESLVGLDDAEVYWISELRRRGCRLTNLTPGGGGTVGNDPSEETRQKMRNRKLGGKLSAEHRRKIGDASRGRKATVETRQKMRESKLAMPHTFRPSPMKGRPGRPHTQEERQKISEASKARAQAPEHKERFRAAHRAWLAGRRSEQS